MGEYPRVSSLTVNTSPGAGVSQPFFAWPSRVPCLTPTRCLRLQDDGELAGQGPRVASRQVVVQPADGLGLALLAAQDEGEEEGGLGLTQ